MTTARRRGTPPTATDVDAGPPSRWSWWSPLPLVAAALATLAVILGSPRIEDRIGPVAATGTARILMLAVVVVCVAHEVGRALAARRPERLSSPLPDDETFDLVAVVSHELRTPLTSLLGLMSTVQRGADRLPPDRLADLAGMACEQGWRLERLVTDLLRNPRDGTDLRPERGDAVATVRDAVASLPAMDHSVVLALPEESVLRSIDHDVLVRVVTNLVGNALKYTPAGSQVTVELRALPTGLELSVTDEGPGIPFEARSKAFDKYWRGESADRKGLGLGLYLVRLLAAAHGGTVTLEDAPAGGCRFTVRLEELDAVVPAPALAS